MTGRNDDLLKALGEVEGVELDLFALPAILAGDEGRVDEKKARKHAKRVQKAIEEAREYTQGTNRLLGAFGRAEAS